jgi:flagellar hook-associated protein 2
MSFAVDGLVSGLDTTNLINSLMQLEGIPQTTLKTKVSANQTFITALQGLNAKVASLATLASDAAKPTSLDKHTATTSNTAAVTATASSGAGSASLTIVVRNLAQAQVAVTAAMAAWPEDPPVLTVVGGDGTQTQITATSTSLDDIVTAINGSAAGVTATKVSAEADGYRLQLTSSKTGSAGSFSIYAGAAVDETKNLLTQPGAAVVSVAKNAEVVLWAGSAAEQIVTSATNTFDTLLPDVAITVAKASTDPVTVTVARDSSAAKKVAESLVSSLNTVFAEISVKSTVTTSTTSGVTSVNGGPFTGESAVRSLRQQLLSAATMPVGGRSPSEMGITITRTGTVEFSAEKFAAALASDPDKVQAALSELAGRVAAAAADASNKTDGQLTLRIASEESANKRLSTQVLEWDDRLSTRRATLERTYAALEVQLSNLNAQASYVASQLAGLPSSSSSNGRNN